MVAFPRVSKRWSTIELCVPRDPTCYPHARPHRDALYSYAHAASVGKAAGSPRPFADKSPPQAVETCEAL